MNYYEILNVDKKASTQEIKKSYKKLIKRYHPDLYPGNKTKAELITKNLNEAYNVLSDPEKRKLYDLKNQEPIEYVKQETVITKTYRPYDYYKEKFSSNKKQNSFEEKLKYNIHSFVDTKTNNISNKNKKVLFLIILIASLTVLLLSLKDYLDFKVKYETEKSYQHQVDESIKQKQIDEYIDKQLKKLEIQEKEP